MEDRWDIAPAFPNEEPQMTPSEMQIQIVRERTAERLRDADRRRNLRPAATPPAEPAVFIRLAGSDDVGGLNRLAELEGRTLPGGDALIAAIDDRVLAAISVDSGETLADPFHHTAGLIGELVEARAHMLGLTPKRGLWARLRRLGGGSRVPRAAGAPSVPGSESLLIR
jgi:hypothetical protein